MANVIHQDTWLTAVASAPSVADNQMATALWTEVAHTIPDGLWCLEWTIAGPRRLLLRYDLAILTKTALPISNLLNGSDLFSQTHYFTDWRGRAIIQGPATFWVRQNPINSLVAGNTEQVVSVMYKAIRLTERTLTHPAPLSTERIVEFVSIVKETGIADLHPQLLTAADWHPSRFHIASANWESAAVAPDSATLHRYSVAPGAPSYSDLVATFVPGGAFTFAQQQWWPSVDPRHFYLHNHAALANRGIRQLVVVWERVA